MLPALSPSGRVGFGPCVPGEAAPLCALCSGNTVSQQLLGLGFPPAPCARAIAWPLAVDQQQSGAKDLQTKGFSLFVINVVRPNHSEVVGS